MSKKTVEVIIASGNNYVIGVKKNQKTLYQSIEKCAQEKPIGYYSQLERNKGRIENRDVTVFNLPEEIKKQWTGAQHGIKIRREVKVNGRYREENAYYLSSIKNGSALLYNYGIRNHWHIENSLHWTKDVTMKEDASKIRLGNAPSIISTLKNGAMNIFRKQGMNQIAKATRLVANDIETLNKLIN
ncbi:ISAs1 family transposase [Reichenbachiella ulvae]|uniref:ISAs1 family transposase n=1 Tax=Reichenbachiella ulvae TaxID=2980104 RepID=A0ABT3CYT5_9BACT|nr:ISAs1 family transposase [Reichenbachiella ulvae]MCV9385455.1 ISAs1 family transposase [Reichenbachiella ulvae]MCV9386006.1 ISAs1 family transposase [Reichenbachiella ulvae]MCV9386299.1 ISAs1 family transposase [Reichenbachiella ulvae]MCV9386432.1 ISAs1 family transposase [Reichenbachiella ulvae]MCV9386439.1 ISAs1 family transposase [Reichenbachiella ulvae]